MENEAAPAVRLKTQAASEQQYLFPFSEYKAGLESFLLAGKGTLKPAFDFNETRGTSSLRSRLVTKSIECG